MRINSISQNQTSFKSLAVMLGTPAQLDKIQQVVSKNNEDSLAIRINDSGEHTFFTIYATGKEDVEKIRPLIGSTVNDETASFLPEGQRYRHLTKETKLAGVRKLLPELPEITDAREVWNILINKGPFNKVFNPRDLKIATLR